MDIDDVLLDAEPVRYTARRPVLTGSFNMSRTRIPYFVTTLTLADAVQNLDLVENLPADLRAHWKLEELFQREINWDRVKTEIVDGYLRRPEKLQFFNALTVALLPTTRDRRLQREYVDEDRHPPTPDKYSNAPWKVLNVGGVELITAEGAQNGYISWNPLTVFPATIDGQHRLAALKAVKDEGNLTSQQLHTSISVIFLVLDPRVGFAIGTPHEGDENPILTVVREIFIDLNKTARAVVRSREILLNDQEVESRCVRQLLAPRVGVDSLERLPLGLVHWQHNVSAKFNGALNTAPFITTVELLHLIVDDLLDIRRPKNPFDEKQIKEFVRSVEDSLHLSARIKDNPTLYSGTTSLLTYVERNHLHTNFEQPFANLPLEYLRVADDAFAEDWRPLFIAIFRRFTPYEKFVEEVRARGGIDGDLAQYLVLPARAQKLQDKEWGKSRFEKIERPKQELKLMKDADWPFYNVFQKALFRASADCWKNADLMLKGTPKLADFLDSWISFLNDMSDRGLFATKAPYGSNGFLWIGIALNPGSKTVRWTESTVERLVAILKLWWYVYATKAQRIGAFYAAAKAVKAAERFPDCPKLIETVAKALRGAVTGPEEQLDEEALEKRVIERLKGILKLAVVETSEAGAVVSEPAQQDDEDDRSRAQIPPTSSDEG